MMIPIIKMHNFISVEETLKQLTENQSFLLRFLGRSNRNDKYSIHLIFGWTIYRKIRYNFEKTWMEGEGIGLCELYWYQNSNKHIPSFVDSVQTYPPIILFYSRCLQWLSFIVFSQKIFWVYTYKLSELVMQTKHNLT